jgi:hypothetical protein
VEIAEHRRGAALPLALIGLFVFGLFPGQFPGPVQVYCFFLKIRVVIGAESAATNSVPPHFGQCGRGVRLIRRLKNPVGGEIFAVAIGKAWWQLLQT